ncbi:unnamed protein product [Camellia sinensis]
MTKTLERYQHCNFNPHDNSVERETQLIQSWYQEVSKLRAKFESLQRTQRHLLGEDLGPLSVKELQNLEKQLEGALAQTRQRKVLEWSSKETQIMVEQMEELRQKERQLGDMNKQLKIKVSLELSSLQTEGQGLGPLPCSWNPTNASTGNTSFSVHPSQPNPMDCDNETVLQIGWRRWHVARWGDCNGDGGSGGGHDSGVYQHYVAGESSVPRTMAGDIVQGWVL